MRCRKVRSCLSAYCNEELQGRQHTVIREHLSSCSTCLREAEVYTSIRESKRELPALAVSPDFNTVLLNRVARERFKETRSKAYLPKRAPLVSWPIVAPIVVSAALAVFVFVTMQPTISESPQLAAVTNEPQPISYLTVQPDNNPNMTANLQKDWSLNSHMALAERFNRLSRQFSSNSGFGANHLTAGHAYASRSAGQAPFSGRLYRVQPIQRIYQSTTLTSSREVGKVY